MKPIKLGSLPSSRCIFKDRPLQDMIDYTKGKDQGTLDYFICDQPELVKYLASYFYKPDERRYIDFTCCNGSLKWHVDNDHGLMAPWLIYAEDRMSRLITKHGPTPMVQGDVVVFNAEEGHAWFSDGIAIFVTATVSRIRK